MRIETFREYCLRKAGVIESTPFGADNLVFKVGGKMFALLALDEIPAAANLKCDPDRVFRRASARCRSTPFASIACEKPA